MKEITLIVSDTHISIDAINIGTTSEQENLKTVLQETLKALERKPDETYKNEIRYNK